MFEDVHGAASFLWIVTGLLGALYFYPLFISGIITARRGRRAVRAQASEAGIHIFYVIAALNEARVIASTVSSLLVESRKGRILVVDDGSDDETASEVTKLASDRVILLRRTLPSAQQGKGAALNDAFAHLKKLVQKEGLDPDKVVVCVMDADGRLSPGAEVDVLSRFHDVRIGAVQLPVRIRNTEKAIGLMQDVEFWVISGVTQYARGNLGSVSLGGNGQWTRMSVLLDLGDSPWSKSMTEDLELGLSVAGRGWTATTSTTAYVSQQGVTELKALLRQRTRWAQGMLQSGRRIPEIWRAKKLPTIAALEICGYLLFPWITILPGILLYPFVVITDFVTYITQGIGGGAGIQYLGWLAAWYFCSFGPALLIFVVYLIRTGWARPTKVFLLAHAEFLWAIVWYVAMLLAIVRMVRGRTNWVKTARVAEAATL